MKEGILIMVIVALMALFPVWLIAAVQDDDPSTSALILEDTDTSQTADVNLRFNFRDAPLDTVLDYMSRAAGFAIIRETDVSGRVDIVSHQSISRDEAVNLLNTVLNEKGYAAIRNGRTLTIVSRDEALKRNIPVKTGRNPVDIPQTDEMVTQIIPVRYSNAVKMIDNLKTLLPDYAVITANESSNAIILTDTQAHIRRMAEIINALDTSISQISTIKVFMLQYTDATDVANMLNELFKTPTSGQQNASNRFPFFGRMRGPGGNNPGDSSQSNQQTQSEALQAASRVVAVADQNTNAVVVSAPEDLMPTIGQLIKDVDTTGEGVTVVRVFPLKYAYAKDMVDVIKNIFSPITSNQSRSIRFGFMRNFGPGGGQNQQQSNRKVAENTINVQADERTNSLVVSAAEDIMPNIENVVKQLDANPAREKKVFVYPLKNADAQAVSQLLGQFYTQQGSQSSTNRNTTNRNTRTNTTSRSTGSSSSSTRRSSSSSLTGR